MFSDECYKQEIRLKQIMEKQVELSGHIVNICIPKVEPDYTITSESNGDTFEQVIIPAPIPYTTPFKVRDPVVVLERCDKIWETLKLIKNVQSVDNDLDDDARSTTRRESECSSALSVPSLESNSTYIKYQPVLGNNNNILPNFKFSVKTTKKVYQCLECGKQYTENRSLRHHSQRIHGILLPLKRRGKAASVVSIEQKGEAEEKIKAVEKTQHHGGNKTEKRHPEELPTSTPSPPEQEQAPTRPKRIRKSNSVNDNNVAIVNGISKQEQNKNKNDTVPQKRQAGNNPIFPESECMLCKKTVRDIRKHLIDYHKIGCIKAMLNGLESVLSTPASTLANTVDPAQTGQKSRNEPLQKNVEKNMSPKKLPSESIKTAASDTRGTKRKLHVSSMHPRKRLKTNNSNNMLRPENSKARYFDKVLRRYLFRCDICLGLYSTQNSYYRHRQYHRCRGETKENFHLFKDNCRYVNSPLRLNFNSAHSSLNKVSESTDNPEKDSFSKDKTEKVPGSDKEALPAKRDYAKSKIVCNCGRSFRNPHTLFVHKSICQYPRGVRKRPVTRSSTDALFANGISITIKKKNDSYEIVSRDSSDDSNSLDTNDPKDSNASLDFSKNIPNVPKDYVKAGTESKNQQIPESSKYSVHHSILKLESVEEDVVVDIEDDSQNSLPTELENDSQATKVVELPVASKQDDTNHKVPTLRALSGKALTDYEQKLCAKDTDCPGDKTISPQEGEKASKRTPLADATKNENIPQCAYCTSTFSTLTEYESHQCTVAEGKEYYDPTLDISCAFCNLRLCGRKNFDKHMELKHPNVALPFQCYHCRESFPSFLSRQFHLNKEHVMPFCSICNQKCRSGSQARHMAYHYGLGIPCHQCKIAYPSRAIVAKHIRRIHPNVNNSDISSAYSPRVFNKKKGYRGQIPKNSINHFEIICRICGKRLCTARTLEIHCKVFHKGEYNVKCNCGLVFGKRRTLDTHLTKKVCPKRAESVARSDIVPES